MVSRELAIEEMKQSIAILEKWISELERPRGLVQSGQEVDEFPDGVPAMLSVAEIQSISSPQLRSELAVAAAKLEAIAST
jgi:hypothetical protein